MFQPNVHPIYLLKRGRLADTCRGPPTPRETSFPDYEVGSTTRENHPPGYLQLKTPSDLRTILSAISSPRICLSALSLGSSQRPLQSLQHHKEANQDVISDQPYPKQQCVCGPPTYSNRHISSLGTGMLGRNLGASPLHLYFAPRCHNTTLAVSKRMARSKVRERCLM